MIGTQELIDIRNIADDWLPDTCTIQTKATTAGAMGGIVEAYTATYTLVPCRIDPSGAGSEAVVNFTVEGQSNWVLNIRDRKSVV